MSLLHVAVCLWLLLGLSVEISAASPVFVGSISGEISVIDSDTNSIVATIPGPVGWSLAMSPNTMEVYSPNNDDTVSVIDVASSTEAAQITTATTARWAAFTPDGLRAYVTNTGDGSVSIVNTVTRSVVGSIALPSGLAPAGIALTSDGAKAYVACQPNVVVVIDLATAMVAATITVGQTPVGVAITPDRTRVYVANAQSDSVSVIDTAAGSVSATIPVGSFPQGIALAPDAKRVYVAAYDASLDVIDTATATVIASIALPTGAHRVALSANGGRAYVTSFDTNTVSVIDTAGLTVLEEIAITAPLGVAAAPILSRPTTADECKRGGWKTYGIFKNQGDCVSFVVSKGKH